MSQTHISWNSIKPVIKMNYDLLARQFMLKILHFGGEDNYTSLTIVSIIFQLLIASVWQCGMRT